MHCAGTASLYRTGRYMHAPPHPCCHVRGCAGSGVLAIAALLLGAASAVGTDTDPLAVQSAAANARLNRVGDRFQVSDGMPAATLYIFHSLFLAPDSSLNLPASRLACGTREGLCCACCRPCNAAHPRQTPSLCRQQHLQQPHRSWSALMSASPTSCRQVALAGCYAARMPVCSTLSQCCHLPMHAGPAAGALSAACRVLEARWAYTAVRHLGGAMASSARCVWGILCRLRGDNRRVLGACDGHSAMTLTSLQDSMNQPQLTCKMGCPAQLLRPLLWVRMGT